MTHDNDIDELLEKWYTSKQELLSLEKKCEKYRKYAEKILNSKNTKTIVTDKYKVSMREMSRGYIAKGNIPDEIWEKYAKTQTFPVLHISKIK